MTTTITLKHKTGIYQLKIHTLETNERIKQVFAEIMEDWEILGIRRGELKKIGE